MKSTELRIGNLVWDDYSGVMLVVEIARSGNIALAKTFNLPSGLYTIDRIEPIPITEEWLWKFGFEKIEHDEITYHELFLKEIGITLLQGDKNGYCDVLISEHPEIRVKYVHQLQNLYFALTGEELELKK